MSDAKINQTEVEVKVTAVTAQDEAEVVRGTSRLKLYVRRYFRNIFAVVGLLILFALVVFAFVGEWLSPWSFDDPDFLNLSTAPSAEHWFGTTEAGHDLFAQTAHGLGRSLVIAISVSLATLIISSIVGAGAALYGGWVEKVVLAAIHFLLAIPSFLLIALIVSDSGGDWRLLIVVLIAFSWMFSARVIWSLSLSIRENDYVRAARYMGISRPKIIIRHMLPNIGSLLVIQFVLGTVSVVMSETALSFLGLGVKLPDVSLGTLLTGGTSTLITAPWTFYFPAGVLTLLTVSLALIADGLRDAIDPNSKSGGKA
ncbi:ABC-type dipeptide/oligopeptide/nickel transport system, permease component [Corynebacterium mustelae]|uniref:Oligopeptide transport system permease protein OppC n=1 Tax=Corynebacterium mustelae TaxID=571915 RepID=A0A0G3GUC8_9CORY|nr:ABC transporter permease [Corynebacterium mustelae]AKK04776.1 ABC-type dipeptide/oligopeptide/nickel transport system, permease component [Corynebacterium mustelae]